MSMLSRSSKPDALKLTTEAEIDAASRSFVFMQKAIQTGRYRPNGNMLARTATKFRLNHLVQMSGNALLAVRHTPPEFDNDFMPRSLTLKTEKDVALLGVSAVLLLHHEQRIKVLKRPETTNPNNNIVELVDCTPDYLPALTTLAALHDQPSMQRLNAIAGSADSGRSSA